MSVVKTSAPTHLRYRPDEIAVIPESPFKNDKLRREPFVSAVTDLLKSIQEPFVIALNAPWGAGKTTTLRMLEPNLTAAGMTVVSFNAWEVDYATDPLVPLVATLHDRLLEIKGYEGVDSTKVDRLKALGNAIARHGLIAGVKLATAGLLDLDAAADSVAKAVSEAADKAGEGLVGDLIDAFKEEREAAKQFRELLLELTHYVRVTSQEGISPPPLVLMIDELDRCRPTFAVAMLERIKHFFNVPGLVFVLALDLEQLKAITRKVYGIELDATEYLRRFVDLELRLPRADVGDMVNAMLTNCGADAFFAARARDAETREDRKWVVDVLKALALHFELPPRAVQRMISRLMLVVRQTQENSYLDPILVVFMIFLRTQDEPLLNAFVTGRTYAHDVMKAVSAIKPGGQKFYESRIGVLIEAYLMYAHNGQHDYVRQYIKHASEIDEKVKDDASQRMREVAYRYQSVCNVHFTRGWVDLRAIDARINLVTTDLKEE